MNYLSWLKKSFTLGLYFFLYTRQQFFSILNARLRTAALVHDTDTQATILNCLLRNYLNYNLIDQAEKLSSKSSLPEMASNNEWARYLYYTGLLLWYLLDFGLLCISSLVIKVRFSCLSFVLKMFFVSCF